MTSTSKCRMSCILLVIVMLLFSIPFNAMATSSSEIKKQIDTLREQKKEIEMRIKG